MPGAGASGREGLTTHCALTEPRAGVCHAGDLREWRVGHRGGDRWQRAGVRRAAQWHAAP
eukprot:9496472-Pyramimonas_sp.AAC.1